MRHISRVDNPHPPDDDRRVDLEGHLAVDTVPGDEEVGLGRGRVARVPAEDVRGGIDGAPAGDGRLDGEGEGRRDGGGVGDGRRVGTWYIDIV